jgi:hypothetical protein
MIAVTALFVTQTAAQILALGLQIATVLGLPTTSWRTGDPERALFTFLANILEAWETPVSDYIKAGFLSTATGDWLTVLALEVYGVEVDEATHAPPFVSLENTGGGFFQYDAGDFTVRASSTGKTYHNTEAITLAGGATVEDIAFEADEAGSDSNVIADEIDEVVTGDAAAGGVEITSSTAATGADEPSEEAIREQCTASLGALSPNGPSDAYEYVVRNSELTGVTDITRARAVDDSDTGEVTIYIAGTTGAVAGASVTAAQDAVEAWATPLCITPTVANATAETFNVTATVSGEDIPAGAEDSIEAALVIVFAGIPLGAVDPIISGKVTRSAIISSIHSKLVALGATGVAVTLTIPAADTTLDPGQVATLGTVAITEA